MPRRNKTIKHDRFEVKNNCVGKRKFQSEQQAKQGAEYQMLINQINEFAVYKCEYCCKWHLTTDKKSTLMN